MDAMTLKSLGNIFGAENVSTEAGVLRRMSVDAWPGNLMRKRSHGYGTASAVVYPHGPECREQIGQLIRLALEHEPHLTIVPHGGGYGVCGAANAVRGEIIVDMTRLTDVRVVRYPRQGKTGLLFAEAGALGSHIDAALMRDGRRLSCGHYPASFYVSTVIGGGVNTGASGQYSFRFGKMKDIILMVRGLDGLGNKKVLVKNALRNIIGTEGGIFIVTGGLLPIREVPPRDGYLAFGFRDVYATAAFMEKLNCLRGVVKDEGSEIYAARSYDWIDYNFIGRPHQRDFSRPEWHRRLEYATEKIICRASDAIASIGGIAEKRGYMPWTTLIYLVSASEEKLNNAKVLLTSEALRCGGRELDSAIAAMWNKNRFKLTYDKLAARFRAGLTVDTLDCSPSWETLPETYRNIRESLFNFGLVGAHIGANLDRPYIYFTFAWPGHSESKYREAWAGALEACIASGPGVNLTNDHHGIGQLKSGKFGELTSYAYGPEWLADAMRIKKEFDPHRILNPNNFLKYFAP